MPVRPITNTLPVVGVAGAMVVGAAFTTLVELVELHLLMVEHHGPLVVGVLVSSQVVGIAVAAGCSSAWYPRNGPRYWRCQGW